MNKRYDYCCKTCWHTWRSEKIYKYCPKCKTQNIDVQSEIILLKKYNAKFIRGSAVTCARLCSGTRASSPNFQSAKK